MQIGGTKITSWRVVIIGVGLAVLCDARSQADAPPGRYTIDEQTVTDTRTRLVWQRYPEAASEYVDPTVYCEQLTIAGDGWRAPYLKELLTLVDPTRVDPALDPTAFPGEQTACCRSRNTYTDEAQLSRPTSYIGTSAENGQTSLWQDSVRVRCVR